MFNKITIVGVGLIGGSIGLAAKKMKLADEIVGVCRRTSSMRKALKFKAIDKTTLDLKRGVADADLVIVATPVSDIVNLASSCVKFMKKGAILTDVGSTKKSIVEKIEKFTAKKVNFIGTHPMAGSEKSGVENATPDIFKGASLIITPTKSTNKVSLARLRKFWKGLGCRIFVISPQKHDMDVSLASYLPHVVSSALAVSQIKDSLKLRAGSFEDMTRISSSDPGLWKEIFLSSGDSVLKSIRVFSKNLNLLQKAIEARDGKAIKKFLDRAKRVRDSLLDGESSAGTGAFVRRIHTKAPVPARARSTCPRTIAIDGPAGSGKSTVAKEVAKNLGFLYIDTGAMYRALTLKAINEGVDFNNKGKLVELSKDMDIELKKSRHSLRVYLDKRDVTSEIRTMRVTRGVKFLASLEGVRRNMAEFQRKLARSSSGAVLEGRDIGTVVFPDAAYKFYLDASFKTRAIRRFKELKKKGVHISLEEVKKDVKERDRSDMTRKIAPLRKAKDAVVIDTTLMTVNQAVLRILEVANGKIQSTK